MLDRFYYERGRDKIMVYDRKFNERVCTCASADTAVRIVDALTNEEKRKAIIRENKEIANRHLRLTP